MTYGIKTYLLEYAKKDGLDNVHEWLSRKDHHLQKKD